MYAFEKTGQRAFCALLGGSGLRTTGHCALTQAPAPCRLCRSTVIDGPRDMRCCAGPTNRRIASAITSATGARPAVGAVA